jgi:AsmA protein
MNVSLLDGTVDGNLDTSYFHNLILKTEKTDLIVNGKILNLSQFVFDENKEIFADLNIRSDMFDLPRFLSFDPKIGRSFPYKIKDIFLNVSLKTTGKKLKYHNVAPEINFQIGQLDATIVDFIPRVAIHRGNFFLGESDSLLHLDFTDFDIEVAGSYLETHVELFRPPDRSLDLHIDLKAQKMNIGKAFYYEANDTIPKLLNAGLNGNMNLFFHYIKIDSTAHLRTIKLNSGGLTYTGITDTLEFNDLSLDAQNIHYEKKTNPLRNLSSSIILSAGNIKNSSFKIKDTQFHILAKDGSYTIVPDKFALFGKDGTGQFIANPFAAPPSYEIKYTVDRFRIEDLLSNFVTKEYLTGPADLTIELVFTGKKWKEISSTMKGRIHLTGDSLVLTGFDFDNFIKKYERSQRFTLADIGAVIVAGPLGLAVTKGTDFTRILFTNDEDSTLITKLYSEWAVQNGNLKMHDVAFTTPENRMASKGWIDLTNDSLDITFAVLNPKGCSILIQNVNGSLKEPKLGDLEVISKLLAPVTNLLKDVFDPDCEPFYNGVVKQPVEPKKQ